MRVWSNLYHPLFGKTSEGHRYTITPGDNEVSAEAWEALKVDERFTKLIDQGYLTPGKSGARRDLEHFLEPPSTRHIRDFSAKSNVIPDHQVFDGRINVDLTNPLESYDKAMRRGLNELASRTQNLEKFMKQFAEQAVG